MNTPSVKKPPPPVAPPPMPTDEVIEPEKKKRKGYLSTRISQPDYLGQEGQAKQRLGQ